MSHNAIHLGMSFELYKPGRFTPVAESTQYGSYAIIGS